MTDYEELQRLALIHRVHPTLPEGELKQALRERGVALNDDQRDKTEIK